LFLQKQGYVEYKNEWLDFWWFWMFVAVVSKSVTIL
jgi:hypothetical protein